MRRLTLFVLAGALLLAACTGLFFDKGNSFPCDFNAGLGVRDLPCVAGDVCGTDNVCRPYFYEGPRFEGSAKLPQFSAGEFATLHPQTLDQPITFLARAPTVELGSLLVRMADGRVVVLNQRGQLKPGGFALDASVRDAVFYAGELTLPDMTVVKANVLGGITFPPNNGPLSYFASSIDAGVFINTQGEPARLMRVTPLPGRFPVLQGIPQPMAPMSPLRVGSIGFEPLTQRLVFDPPYDLPPDAGRPLDVGMLARTAPPEPIVLTRDAIFLGRADGGFEGVAAGPFADPSTLRFNGPASVMAIESVNMGPMGTTSVLSTWQVGVERGQHVLQQPWADCNPCKGFGTLRRATPLPPGELGVEVLCTELNTTTNEPTFTLLKVTGSNAVIREEPCLSEPLALPLNVKRFNVVLNATNVRPVSAEGQRGVAVGGTRGEVWAGETLSQMQPLALERVPIDVAMVPVAVNGVTTRRLLALTDRYVAVNAPPGPASLPVGFRRIDGVQDFGGRSSLAFLATIRGVDGWGVLADGVVARVDVDEDESSESNIRFGPRLTTPAGAPILRTAGGEAFVEGDGGLVSLIVTADDGLYLVAKSSDTLSDTASKEDLTPQLQPEPSVPIRSLALERTPLGTDGVTRARGYLVTSRNVYEWKFGGSPGRWSSSVLAVADGEPLEVWFDTNRSALGRVGYSDGRIFTLPGGFQLAVPIPGDDAGTVVEIRDYENFGGWPVALATNGLFIARWDQTDDGKLLNKFPDGGVNRPMEWREITQPDGGRPWARGAKTRGKLFVNQENLTDGGIGREFRLFVFVDDGVYQVGAFTR